MSGGSNIKQQLKVLADGAIDLISPSELEARLAASAKSRKPLRIKYGADPSAPDLHLGHTVPLRKLRQFQDFGHTVVFIIGDFTARIGDPAERLETRPMLSPKQVKENAATYQKQVFRILDKSRTEVRFNSEWLDKMKPEEFLNLTSQYTVARLLERDDFQKRYKENRPISLVEFLYPLLQGYDSVIVKSDLEVGGSDQKFNLLVGRELQKIWNQTPQCILTLPLIEGTDGVKKMSKSFGNAIAVEDSPKEMFGKIMRLADPLMPRYYRYVSGVAPEVYEPRLKEWMENDPRQLKARLAEDIVAAFHGKAQAAQAREEFDRIFRDKGLPDEIPETRLAHKEYDITSLLKECGLVASKGEARRLVAQGGVKVDQRKVSDPQEVIKLDKAILVQCGKRKFAKVHHERAK